MSDYRELIAEQRDVEQYCHCQSCGSKAELHENPEGTLFYKCTECGWFGLKYSEEKQIDNPYKSTLSLDRILEIAQDCGVIISEGSGIKFEDECKYCEVDVDDREMLFVLEDSFYECEIYIDGNGNLTDNTSDKKINYCPMCGRKL